MSVYLLNEFLRVYMFETLLNKYSIAEWLVSFGVIYLFIPISSTYLLLAIIKIPIFIFLLNLLPYPIHWVDIHLNQDTNPNIVIAVMFELLLLSSVIVSLSSPVCHRQLSVSSRGTGRLARTRGIGVRQKAIKALNALISLSSRKTKTIPVRRVKTR